MSNAREFWLKFAEAYGDEDQIFDEKSDHHQKQIHVIEFEAYRKAVEALKEISEYKWCPACKGYEQGSIAKETLRELRVEI